MKNIVVFAVMAAMLSVFAYAEGEYDGSPSAIEDSIVTASDVGKVVMLFGAAIPPMAASIATYQVTGDGGAALAAFGAGIVFDLWFYQGIEAGYQLRELEYQEANAKTSTKTKE